MHNKTLNIASICFVALLIVFVITKKADNQKEFTNNIQTEEQVANNAQARSQAYQTEILKTVLDQNIKSFESVSESFKKKPTDTLSDTIAKNVFSQYIEYNTSKSLDVDKIQEETVLALKEHPVTKSNISLQNIHLSANTTANLKAYGNSISVIQTELNNRIYKIRNKSNKSVYIKNLYKTATDIYLKQPVPESLAKEHLGIINGYTDYARGFELLELQSEDPAKALTGVQLAKDAQDTLLKSFSSIKKIVLLNNIKYTPQEPAYVWFMDTTGTEQIKTN